MPTITIQESTRRFLSTLLPPDSNGCIETMAGRRKRQDCYGSLGCNGKRMDAHRFMFIAAGGYIPPGMQVLHKCDHKWCVNPYHLYLGTHAKNMQDCRERKSMRPPRGEGHSAVKLTEDQVREIKRNHLGLNGNQWAIRLGVSPGTIYYILNGRNWRHIQ